MRQAAKISLVIGFLAGIYFTYIGVTTTPWEGDSREYHIPIAQSIVRGTFLTQETAGGCCGMYPGAAEVILAALMALKIPLNLYNVLAWGALLVVMRQLAMKAGIKKEAATISAISVGMLPTVVRLFTTQLVDIWIAVWWGWCLWLLLEPKKDLKYWLQLGVAVGMLVGTKFTGAAYLVILIMFFGKEAAKKINWRNGLAVMIGIMGLGGIWYVRNWILMGNPVYPATLFGWRGDSNLKLPVVWRTLMFEAQGRKNAITAMGSEFLLWMMVWVIPVVKRNKLVWLGMTNTCLFLIMPGGVTTILSNYRYLLPAIMPLMIAGWQWAQEKKREEWLATVAIATMVMVIPQLDYRPKIWLLGGGIIGGWLWIKH
jgi:4-amino-4-deoxy-L-arabinose transferase-like glycosyltransferase